MKFEFSAGGIVYRHVIPAQAGIHAIEILVCQHSQHHGWVFPKGFIGDKEEFKHQTKEETALREVKEETGIDGKIIQPLTPSEYWYEMDGTKRKKTVCYFLMEYVSGDIHNHDWEMENVEWLPVEKVEEKLTYESDKKIWKIALRAINRRLKAKK